MSTQFKPYLVIINEMIPTVEIGESFVYLGKQFSFNMKPDHFKAQLITEISKYMDILNRLSLHPKNKLQIILRYVYSKLRWRFSIYRLSETWVAQNLDSTIKEYVKRWLHLPQSANFRHLYLPAKQLGLQFSLPSDIYSACQITTKEKVLKLQLVQKFRNSTGSPSKSSLERMSYSKRKLQKIRKID